MEQLQSLKKLNLSLLVSACVFLLGNEVVLAGGYVNGNQTLNPANAGNTGSVTVTPTFNNAQFTNKVLVSSVNNNKITTPSTVDPVSTVSGNNYHDETDIRISGRNGLNYGFTRTYNSGQSAATVDVGMGYGWVHSYGMKLVSNNFGANPNQGTTAQTGSISYTDERGGQENFVVTSGTYAITNPLGVFDTLSVNPGSTTVNGRTFTLNAGQYAMTFRNGVQYLFQDPTYSTSSDMRSMPGKTARLIQISDPYGNQINLTYTGNNLTGIADNLGISGRSGLTLKYNTDSPVNHLTSITDWSGRTWQYGYTNGYLATYTDPLSNPFTYYYTAQTYYNNFQTGTGYYLLQTILSPVQRNGMSVYTMFNYYQNGRAINDSDGLGDTEIMDYDLYRQRTRVTDPRGFIREYDYDGNGFQTEMKEPDGGILYFTSQADNLRATKTDALGYKTQYSYCLNQSATCATSTGGSDTAGNVTLEQDALGNSIKTTYGIYDQVASVTDKNGNTTSTSFYTTTGQQANKCDLAGKPNTVTLAALGSATNVAYKTFCWNSNGTLNNVQEYLDTAGQHIRTTNYTYDINSFNITDVNVTSTNPTNIAAVIHTHYGYDNLGRKTSQIFYRTTSITNSALEALTTNYTYDALDRVVKTQNPEGRVDQTVYDGNGKVYQKITWYPSTMARTNCTTPAIPSGYTTSYVQCTDASYQYDAADRRTSSTDIFGNVTKYAYDQSSNLISQTDPNVHTTQYQYDAMSRKTAVTDANGRTTQTIYNQRGDVTSVTNPNGETTTNVYDSIGRLTKSTDNMGNVMTYVYDNNGNKICMTDPNGNSVTTAPGHQPTYTTKISSTLTISCTKTYFYDQLNHLIKTLDAQGNPTSYTYNLFGKLLTITDAKNNTATFNYDDLGRLSSTTDPLLNTISVITDEAGNTIQTTDRKGLIVQQFYDVLNRNIQNNYEADSTTDTYNYNQYDDLVTVQNNSLSYTLNYDSKHRLTSKIDSRLGLSESWTYDATDNIHSKTDYQGNVTTYQYDDSNRLTAETNQAYLEVSYHYDPAGRLLDRILSNGAKTSYQYDKGGRLSSLLNSTISNVLVNSTAYTRDGLGNILTSIEAGGTSQVAGTSTFTYDPEYRLLTSAYPTTANNETITYDPVGNRKTYTKGSTTLYYNVNAANRLTTINTTSATGPVYESYTYDNNGSLTNIGGNRNLVITWNAHNRVSQIQVGAIAPYNYQYDIDNYRISKNLGSIINNYYLENGKLESIYDNNGNVQAKYMRGSIIDEVVNGYQLNSGVMTNYTYHHDSLQSVLSQSGNTGTVVTAQSYTSFGSIVNASGNSNNTLKYTGRELDLETGLYYYRARYYDPLLGRFLSEDPKGFTAGVNFYTYTNNNPVNANDPSGLDANVTVDGNNVVNIQIPITYTGPAATPDVIKATNTAIENQWTGVFDPYLVTTKVVPGDDNNINLANGSGPNAVSYVQNWNSGTWYYPGQGNYSYEAPHEAGHLMGLPDQYVASVNNNGARVTTPLPGYQNNIMGAYGQTGVTGSDIANIINANTPWYTQVFNSIGSFFNSIGNLFSSSASSSSAIADSEAAVDGGFVIYPNKSNTSQLQRVYSKK